MKLLYIYLLQIMQSQTDSNTQTILKNKVIIFEFGAKAIEINFQSSAYNTHFLYCVSWVVKLNDSSNVQICFYCIQIWRAYNLILFMPEAHCLCISISNLYFGSMGVWL